MCSSRADPLDPPVKRRPGRPAHGDGGRRRPPGGDHLLEQPLCRPVRHQPADAEAGRQTHPENLGAVTVHLPVALLQAGPGDPGRTHLHEMSYFLIDPMGNSSGTRRLIK